ncbi:MAG: JAB domain-containing protein [Eubacteriales bacterium]|nr:JAB domain-containing protein [Eubacteriales bacterium]
MPKKTQHELPEVKVRLRLEQGTSLYSDRAIDTPETAVEVMADMMANLDREHLCIVNLDARSRPIAFNIVSIGGVAESRFDLQNIFKSAMLQNASSLIALHNHPSSEVSPSWEDIEVTKKIVAAGRILDLPLLDHIIVGGFTGEAYSMREDHEGLFRAGHTFLKSNDPSDLMERKSPYSVGKPDSAEYRKQREEKMKQLTDMLEAGVKNVFESDTFAAFLKTMAAFPKYSIRNQMLLYLQMQEKGLDPNQPVCGYNAWKERFGRNVMRGQQSLKIFAPMKFKTKREQDKVDSSTNQPVRNPDGSIQKEEVEVSVTRFKVENVFALAQTTGKPLPSIYHNLEGDVNRYDQFLQALHEVSPVPVSFEPMTGKDGYYSQVEKRIAIRDDMSQRQTALALLHEITHAYLHDLDMDHLEESLKERGKDNRQLEIEAEGSAYVCATYFGIDVAENSLGYITGYSSNKELPELYASLQTIRDNSLKIIESMEKTLTRIRQEELEKDPFLTNTSDQYAIYQLDPKDKEIPYRFMNTTYIERNDLHIRVGDYRQVYHGAIEPGMTLDTIYEKFNLSHPEDFKGHSLSISDVVILRKDGEEKAYYVDNFGFKELPDFVEILRSPLSTLPVYQEKEQQTVKELTQESLGFADPKVTHDALDPLEQTFQDILERAKQEDEASKMNQNTRAQEKTAKLSRAFSM